MTYLANIGRCILLCQSIEYGLGLLLVLERQRRISGPKDIYTFLDTFSKTRVQVLESIRNELKNESASYLETFQLDQIIERRNRLVHRLVHDPDFLEGIGKEPKMTMDEEVDFFLTAHDRILAAIHNRARQLGIVISTENTSSPETICQFAGELKQRTDAIRGSRKKS
jgi:hypothetical protein